MSEGNKRSRRRRGRGGQGRQQPPGPERQQPAARVTPDESQANGRPARRDTRRGKRQEPAPAEQPGRRGRIQRSPAAPDRGERREPARASRDGRANGAGRRDRTMRTEPVPQDARSVELGAQFREAHIALRDARKALEKRRAEFDDEPEWMVDQYRAAEARFEQLATEWSEHLSKTGRKVVRR